MKTLIATLFLAVLTAGTMSGCVYDDGNYRGERMSRDRAERDNRSNDQRERMDREDRREDRRDDSERRRGDRD